MKHLHPAARWKFTTLSNSPVAKAKKLYDAAFQAEVYGLRFRLSY